MPCYFLGAIARTAMAENADTTILYFKVTDGVTASVRSMDEADFFRLVLPPDSGDNRHNIQEFYKDGKIKLIGKTYEGANAFNATSGVIMFDGECVSYYPTGKKMSITHYKHGFKDGLEYLFYPSGKVYCGIKHRVINQLGNTQVTNWECYDKDGNEICIAGNGKWIVYDKSYTTVNMEGQVTDGYMDGEWRGIVYFPDTIKFAYRYKKGKLVSSEGFDKNGNPYPFQNEFERATYKSGPLVFLEILRNRVKLPRDINGKKMLIDTMHVSFVVERDGKLSQFGVSEDVNSQLKEAVFSALEKSNEWIPTKIYGIPYRTKIILPLSEISGWNTKYKGWESYRREIWYKESIIKD